MAELIERFYRRRVLRYARPLREPSSIILERSPRGSGGEWEGF